MITDNYRIVKTTGFFLMTCSLIALIVAGLTIENPKPSGLIICLMIVLIGFVTHLIGMQLPISKELNENDLPKDFGKACMKEDGGEE